MRSGAVRCVVDTDVAVTANGRNAAASPECMAACARALLEITSRGHVFVDDGRRIVGEYQNNLAMHGDPREGTAFLKWLLTNEWNPGRVTRVVLTPKPSDPDDFEELPQPPAGVCYDPSDRKFLAVAAAHADHPKILQALDSKWWGWREALEASGVAIHFLCPAEIARKHAEKMGP